MNFGEALELLKTGQRAKRTGWPRGTYITLQRPDGGGKMTGDYLYQSIGDSRVPWNADHADLLAEDWAGVTQ
jgi:hypothetical protein